MNFDPSKYLSQLPTWARELGDSTKGEIELLPIDSAATDYGIVFEDKYVLLIRDSVQFPGGTIGSYVRIFERSGIAGDSGVIIVPIWNRKIVFRKVYRHATRHWETELPRGYRETTMSSEEAVRSEILEEIGMHVKSMTELGPIVPNSAILANISKVYLAILEGDSPRPTADVAEALGEFVFVDVSDVNDFIRLGNVRCGLSLSALMLFNIHREILLTNNVPLERQN